MATKITIWIVEMTNSFLQCTSGIDTVKMALSEYEKVVNRVAREIVGIGKE